MIPVYRCYLDTVTLESSCSPAVRRINMLSVGLSWCFAAHLYGFATQLHHPQREKNLCMYGNIQLALGKELSFPFAIADWLSLMASFEECSPGIMHNMF